VVGSDNRRQEKFSCFCRVGEEKREEGGHKLFVGRLNFGEKKRKRGKEGKKRREKEEKKGSFGSMFNFMYGKAGHILKGP